MRKSRRGESPSSLDRPWVDALRHASVPPFGKDASYNAIGSPYGKGASYNAIAPLLLKTRVTLHYWLPLWERRIVQRYCPPAFENTRYTTLLAPPFGKGGLGGIC